jgi:DNA replication protein DnaC
MTTLNPAEIKARLKTLGLFGLLACCDEIADKPWLPEVLAIEERERQKRSLERRLRNSRVAAFKPMADFDWAWPKKIDREAVDELFTLSFVKTGHNAVLVGPNGVGKTMILKNVADQAVVRGHTVRFATASDMLADLAAQESSVALARRYDTQKPVLLSTNKAFTEWSEVFPHAACVVTLVDRLIHRAEVIDIDAESYRLKEAKELNAARTTRRRTKKHGPPSPVNFTGISRARHR